MNIRESLAILLLNVCVSSSFAQSYPARPVRMIVTTQAGSGTDVTARYLADGLLRATGQRFIIENHLGASGNIGMAVGARAAPDGYTLIFFGLGTVLAQFMFASLDYDAEKDFDPITPVVKLPFLIAVNPSFAGSSIPDLVAEARAKPNTINVAVTSAVTRIPYELFTRSIGAPLFLIPYNGPGPAITDTIGGRVPMIIETLTALLPHVKSGKLKALAVTSQKTSSLLPNVKSVAEQGFPDFGEFVGWTALFAPKGTPREAISVINTEINKILSQPETRQRLAQLGAEVVPGSPEDLSAYMAAERKRWGPIIRSAKITAQ